MPILNPRHRAEIENLPPKYKWEMLRRHTHYIRDWKMANLDGQVPSADPGRRDPEWRHVEAAIARMHLLTGFHEQHYPDPAQPAEKVLSVLPVGTSATTLSVRDALEVIIWNLPPALQHAVGQILTAKEVQESPPVARYVRNDGKDLTQENQKVRALARLRGAALDAPLPGNLAVNLNAPLRGIVSEVSRIVKEEKARRGIVEKRPRPEKLDQYLEVWDLREGWHAGKYDGRQEEPVRVVAAKVRRSPNTVVSQYKSAFLLIFGVDYSPLNWWTLVARHKWPYSKYKGWRNSKSRPQLLLVTGARVEAVSDDQGMVEFRDLAEKIRELSGKGIDHREIARRLEIESHFNVGESEAKQIVEHLASGTSDL